MDIYTSTYDGCKIDLEDLSIYPEEWKQLNIRELFNKCWSEAGKSIFYMKYIHPDVRFGAQWNRVDELCKELVRLQSSSFENIDRNRLKMMKWLYRFKDEVENQC